ncbi:MAG: TlpA family protein disulfide reductase [Bryobacteraceae bacterium]|nr:TlpA family protein disulfide reductase [Bryobacteraceae bacterium]MDW8376891.1 TlpA disulfide reductase family protein [Bryobacterales bacterium]
MSFFSGGRKAVAVALSLALAALTAASLRPVDETGYRKAIAAHKGKVVLVNFWATYCIPCRKEMPALVQLAAKYGPKGLVLLTVSADEPEQQAAAEKFLLQNKVPEPHYWRQVKDEDTFIRSIDASWSGALPASFLYDRSGKKVKTFVGELDLKLLEKELLKHF